MAAEFRFPDGFLWGAATSSHQVEGKNTKNDWWAWEQAGRVKASSGLACDQYHRFRDDFDLAKQIGHTAHRLSIEWSRIEPRDGELDSEAIAHYQDVVRALRERQLEPIVTLHHFTTPQWLAEQGGWADPRIVERFARYAQRMAEALPEARYWVTINEPMVYVWMHYLAGIGPPGAKDWSLGARVIEHLARAHVAAYRAMHKAARRADRDVLVGVATHLQPLQPCRPWWPLDRGLTALVHRAYNLNFLDAVTEGRLHRVGLRPLTIPDGRDCMDFLGMHYYGRAFIRSSLFSGRSLANARCGTEHHPQVTEKNLLGWDVYAPGLAEIIRWGRRYQRPIFITENGICTDDDAQRERFIVEHVRAMAQAMQEGADVRGYLYWSLLDNFEWAEGFRPRFGLIEVDYATQARRARPSARRFAEICRANRLLLDSRHETEDQRPKT